MALKPNFEPIFSYFGSFFLVSVGDRILFLVFLFLETYPVAGHYKNSHGMHLGNWWVKRTAKQTFGEAVFQTREDGQQHFSANSKVVHKASCGLRADFERAEHKMDSPLRNIWNHQTNKELWEEAPTTVTHLRWSGRRYGGCCLRAIAHKSPVGRYVTSSRIREECSWSFGAHRVLDQRFRKGVGRQRGLAQGSPSHTIDAGLFSAPLFLFPLMRRRTQLWGTIFAVFWVRLVV